MARIREIFPIILLLPLGACTAATNPAVDDGIVTNWTSCDLPADQGSGSLHGAWSTLPVPIVLDNDFYVTNAGAVLPSMRASLESWDVWAVLKGYSSAYSIRNDVGGNSGGEPIPQVTACSQAAYTASVPGVVGVWKIASDGYHANQRASCGTNANGQTGTLLPPGLQGQTDWEVQGSRIVGASILLNFYNFNSPGNPDIDVQSLLLHELGHVLGLLHSCNGSNPPFVDSTTAPSCFVGGSASNGLNVIPAYANAVMFPFLQAAQLRRELTQNDLSRVNCLY